MGGGHMEGGVVSPSHLTLRYLGANAVDVGTKGLVRRAARIRIAEVWRRKAIDKSDNEAGDGWFGGEGLEKWKINLFFFFFCFCFSLERFTLLNPQR